MVTRGGGEWGGGRKLEESDPKVQISSKYVLGI